MSEMGSLRFPDVPKLELDELIDQLVERAYDVKRAQGRLRALLRAIRTVTGIGELDTVLHNIVDGAVALIGAEHGALAVVEGDRVERVVHAGDEPARDGTPPAGAAALLAEVVRDQRPVRWEGEGAGNTPGESFLGVPIVIGGAVFGSIHLTGSPRGAFTAEDEELLVALASAAGTAIDNARMFADAQQQQRWLSATVEIGSQLLTDVGEDPLRLIARRVYEIAGADLAIVGLLTEDGSSIVIEQGFGERTAGLIGRRFALHETIAGLAVGQHRPVLLPGPGEDVDDTRLTHLQTILDAGPTMVLPLDGAQGVRGVLSVLRTRGRPRFSETDLAMAAGFASHASVALQLADSRAAEQRVVLLEDRDRIARDLHDHVIQELFAIGLSLQSVAAGLGPDSEAGERIGQRIEDIDRTIRRIRTSIFELRSPLTAERPGGLRATILEIAAELTPVLGFAPHVGFSGLVDHVVDPVFTEDVTAVIRETLTNVAKHAHASRVSIDIDVSATDFSVSVSDDGVGAAGASRSSGIANLRVRAERREGCLDVSPAPGGGTLVVWKVPTP